MFGKIYWADCLKTTYNSHQKSDLVWSLFIVAKFAEFSKSVVKVD